MEDVSREGVSGGHNINAFKAIALPNAGARVEIISEVSKNGVTGVKDIQYKTLAMDAKGKILQSQYIQKDGVDKIFTKTVYDPSIYPDDVVEDIGVKAFKNAMEKNLFDTWGDRAFEGYVNGKTIYGHYEIVNGEKIGRTWWIEK